MVFASFRDHACICPIACLLFICDLKKFTHMTTILHLVSFHMVPYNNKEILSRDLSGVNNHACMKLMLITLNISN